MTARWLEAARPATLWAAVVPVLVGASAVVAAGLAPRWTALGAALFGAVWIQIGTNFANDVFDAEKGADTAERLGPRRAVQAGLISAAAMRRAMVVAFGLASVAGAYLAVTAGWPVVVIGLLSVAAGVAYTGGPWPLGYHGLGDLLVMIFFGFVAVCGTAWVGSGQIPSLAVWCGLGIGALSTAVLVVNNLRDLPTDEPAGKRTLVVRFGRRFAVAEYAGLLAVAELVPLGLWATGLAPRSVLLPLLSMPLAGWLAIRLSQRSGRALNPMLGQTARLLLLYGVLLATGLLL